MPVAEPDSGRRLAAVAGWFPASWTSRRGTTVARSAESWFVYHLSLSVRSERPVAETGAAPVLAASGAASRPKDTSLRI